MMITKLKQGNALRKIMWKGGMTMIDAMIWLGVFIFSIVIELATMGLFTIWFAGGSLIALIVALLGAPMWLQITLFILISVVLLLFTRPIAMKYYNKGRTKTNVDSLIGEVAVVTETIDNLEGKGAIRIKGLEWSAKSEQDGVKIFADTKVIIQKIEGVSAIVIAKCDD